MKGQKEFHSVVHALHIIFIICSSFIVARSSDDIQSLFDLRDTLTKSRASIPSWFDTKIPPCNWSGITCLGDNVQCIDLSTTPLNLQIPKCIGEFQALEVLNLSDCSLTGPIPATLGNLQNLHYLDLSMNYLSGLLPSSLFSLTKLKEIVLDSNRFTGSLSPSIGALGDLTKLSLSENSFSGSLPDELGNLRNLDYLDLSVNSFSGILPSSLGNLAKLQYLDLSKNAISGSVFPWIKNLTRLISLDFSYNSLVGSIPPEIGSLTNLESLSLGSNSFDGSIPSEIGNLMNLKIIGFQNCKLGGKVPDEIFNLKNLTGIDISENYFEGGLPEGIGELVNLVYFLATRVGLSGRIPAQLGKCRNLRSLDLSFNSFSGPLPDSLMGLESINTFIVEVNHLSGPIPPWISNWKRVTFITLAKNQFTGSLLPLSLPMLTSFSAESNSLTGEIPSNICSESTSLTLISFAENRLTGGIKDSFRSCSKLTDLILLGNHLNGEVPDYFGDLPLVTLELTQNNFSGEIPAGLLNSQTLLELSLAENLFVGRIPDSIGKMRLERLMLDGNFFEGEIPSSIGKLENLTTLSISRNRLMGRIPPELFNCTKLVTLDLSSNSFTGPIPRTISQLKLLDNLVLSRNQLSGPIPGEICSGFQKLNPPDSEFIQHHGVLDLSSNAFVGQIPPELALCTGLVELRLQGNCLNGSIPRELANLLKLTYVDMSENFLTGLVGPELSNLQGLLLAHNRLSGPIPDKLSETMPSLVKLNLSSNSLTGPFPASALDIKSLTHLDISRNSLGGSISLPGGRAPLLVLNVSNNFFSGELTQTLSNFTSLAVLDIHNNSITGAIPQSMSGLASLTYFDASANHLRGAIPCGVCDIDGLSYIDFSANDFNGYDCAAVPGPCEAMHLSFSPLRTYPPTRARASTWGIALGVVLGVLGSVLLLLKWRSRRRQATAASATLALAKANRSTVEPASTDELLGKKSKEPLSINIATFEHPLLRVTLADILAATENFSKAHVIGDGGFGTVYKASLPESQTVAVKRLNGGYFQGDREFLAEMETIGKVKHPNLVPLLGYCVFSDERFLVYEYMENGSLETWLRNRDDAREALDWATRLKICLGSACGLAFLHHGFVPHIIHRDMKSSNILLDRAFEARVSDFGLARIISACETHVSTDLAGTFGYIPPEYGQTMKATAKGDVYSFGVVVMEVLTGRAPTGQEEGEGGGNLVGWVRWMVGLGQEEEVFDAWSGAGVGEREQMRRVLAVARVCTCDEPWMRPSMLEVVRMLKEIKLVVQ
ncbi:Leucine-rich repeat receptor protein kinase EXS [Acorus calamus]|uniref:non-specific serine/threonine protein kinase n=1 Tax=Acorus calamus TaxID=4465 RepID=A0AAV9ECB0_ACOCL|nr:Leucine-rich repeat receptor protein kinase EXS [Acorus calamus]